MSTLDEQIRALAYHLWQQDGCPDGQEMDHWLQAEALLRPGSDVVPAPQLQAAEPDAAPTEVAASAAAASKPAKPASKPRRKPADSAEAKPKSPRKSKKAG